MPSSCRCGSHRPAPAARGAERLAKDDAAPSRPDGTATPSVGRAERLGHRVLAAPYAVQRTVDLANLTATETAQYFVDPARTSRLYSVNDAQPPAPRGLYGRTDEPTTLGGSVRVWLPNARLVSSRERGEGVDPAALTRHTEGLFSGVELQNQPSLGILGKNDCDFFAGTLQFLIAEERQEFADEEGGSRQIDVEEDEVPELGVGDRMRHKFAGERACGHHAATVVAKDGASLVTLEAHVSKDIQAPEFHIRNGVTGFVTDNDTDSTGESRGLGGKVELRQLASITEEEAGDEIGKSEQRFRRIRGDEAVRGMTGEDFIGTGLGITREPGRRRNRYQVLGAVRTLLGDGRWSSQGQGFFSSKTPSGVASLREIANRDLRSAPKLLALRRKAAERLAIDDPERSTATTRLYRALAALDTNDPDPGVALPALLLARGFL